MNCFRKNTYFESTLLVLSRPWKAYPSKCLQGFVYVARAVLELLIELVRLLSLASDPSGREFVGKASGKNFLNKLALGR